MKLQHSFLLACLAASPVWAQQRAEEKKIKVQETQKSESAGGDAQASGSASATASSNGVTKSETRGFDSKTGRHHRIPSNQPGHGAAQDQKPVPYIGVLTREVSPELRSQFSLPEGFGLMVEEVMPDSPAEKAGLKVHDLLLKFEDQQLVSMEQLMLLVRSKKKGDTVSLTTISGGKESQVPVTLGEKMMPAPQSTQNNLARAPHGMLHFTSPADGFGNRMYGFQNQSREFNEQMQRFQQEMQQYQQRIQEWARQGNQGPMPQPPMFIMPGQQPRRSGQVNGGVQLQPMNPANGNGHVQQFSFSESHAATNITRRDESGEYTLKREDGKTTFIARPNNGQEQSWPVNTDDERKAMPEQLRDKLRMMDGPASSIRIEVKPGSGTNVPPQIESPVDGGKPQRPQKPTTSA